MARAKKVIEDLPPLVDAEEEESVVMETGQLFEEEEEYQEGEQDPYRFTPQSTGRTVSVPLWNRASSAPRTSRLRVQFVEIDGNATECGHLNYDASLETLIRKWPKSGTFLVMPVDQMNRPMSHDPLKFIVSKDHDILRQVQGATNGSAGGVSQFMSSQIPPEVWNLIEANRKNSEMQVQMLLEQKERLQDEMRAKEERVSKERMALAVNNTTAALDVQQQLISRAQERDDATQQHVMVMMQAMSENAEQRHAMAMERMKSEALANAQMVQANQSTLIQMLQNGADSERQRNSDDRERLRLAREEERRWELDRRKADQLETRERENQRWEAQQRQHELERQYHDRQMELLRTQSEASDPFNSIEKLLEKGTGLVELVKLLGVDKLLGGNSQTGLVGVAAETVGKALEGYLEIAKIQAGAGAGAMPPGHQIEAQHAPESQYQVQLPDGRTVVMTESEVAAYQENVRQYQEQQQAQGAEGAVAPQEPQETPQAEVAKPYNPFAAAIAQLDPKIQKASRAAIRQTIELLKQADESKWESIVTAMATKTPEILEYVGASSLAYVMHEGGASAEMITKVITEIKEKGLAPDTLRLS